MTDKLTGLRLELAHHGYPPVPVTSPDAVGVNSPGKAPRMPNWQNVCRDAGDSEITSWRFRYSDCGNTGILCGTAVAIDVDVLDQELGDKIEVHIRTRLGETPLRRVGLAPKRLLVFRTDTPFHKISTALFSYRGKPARVEVLAEGEQFVAFGEHPSGREYTWTGDSPLEMAISDLPTVSAELCGAFLEECEIIMIGQDAVHASAGARTSSRPHTVRGNGAAPGIWCGKPGARPPRELVLDALRHIPNTDFDRDTWIALGFSLYAALGPDGGDVWDEWSAQYAGNVPANNAHAWASFANIRYADHRKLFSWAEMRGWRGWPAEDREGVAAKPAAKDAPRPLLEPLTAYDPAAELPYVVRGVIAAGQAITLIGGPGCGKTTLACLLAVCVAAGKPWMGFETETGPVIYIAAEAPVGTHKRLTAACGDMDLKLGNLPVRTMRQPLFLDDFDLVSRVIGEARDFLAEIGRDKVSLVILDTFARCIAGADENSAEHIGAAMKTVNRIQAELGCAAVILHHPSKANPTQARGSSAMIGAVDGELVAERDTTLAESVGTLSPGKPNRDLELFAPVSFRLKPVDLGADPRGDMVRTVVAVAEGGETTARKPPLTGQVKIAYDTLVEAIAAHGEPLPGNTQYPAHTTGVRIERWRAVFYNRTIEEQDVIKGDKGDISKAPGRHTQKKAFKRGVDKLKVAGRCEISQPFAWLIK